MSSRITTKLLPNELLANKERCGLVKYFWGVMIVSAVASMYALPTGIFGQIVHALTIQTVSNMHTEAKGSSFSYAVPPIQPASQAKAHLKFEASSGHRKFWLNDNVRSGWTRTELSVPWAGAAETWGSDAPEILNRSHQWGKPPSAISTPHRIELAQGMEGLLFNSSNAPSARKSIQKFQSISGGLLNVTKLSSLKFDPALAKETWACCCGAALFSCSIIVAWYTWQDSREINRERLPGQQQDADRSSLLDNAKAFAMYLVILQHYCWMDGRFEHSDFFRFLKMIDMPLFSLISGICSQRPPNVKRVCSLITNIALPTIIYVFLFAPLQYWLYGIYGDAPLLALYFLWALNPPAFFSFVDAAVPWYLVSLFLWRILAYTCLKHFNAYQSVVACCFISCVCGYYSDPLNGKCFEGTLGFVPYFAIGYVLPFDVIMDNVSNMPIRIRLAAAIFSLVWLAVIATSHVSSMELPDPDQAYFGLNTQILNRSEQQLFWTWRLTKIGCDVVPCFLLLVFVLPRQKVFLISWAGNNTVYAYLHQFFGIHLTWNFTIGLSLNLMLAVVGYSAASFMLLLVLTSPPWICLFSWAVEPTWVHRLLCCSVFKRQ